MGNSGKDKKISTRQRDEERQATTKREKSDAEQRSATKGRCRAAKSDDERQRANEDKRRRATVSKKGADGPERRTEMNKDEER